MPGPAQKLELLQRLVDGKHVPVPGQRLGRIRIQAGDVDVAATLQGLALAHMVDDHTAHRPCRISEKTCLVGEPGVLALAHAEIYLVQQRRGAQCERTAVTRDLPPSQAVQAFVEHGEELALGLRVARVRAGDQRCDRRRNNARVRRGGRIAQAWRHDRFCSSLERQAKADEKCLIVARAPARGQALLEAAGSRLKLCVQAVRRPGPREPAASGAS